MESLVTIGGVDYTLFRNHIEEVGGKCLPSIYLGTDSGGEHSTIAPFAISLSGTDYGLTLDWNGATYNKLSGGVYDSTAWELSRSGDIHTNGGINATGNIATNGDCSAATFNGVGIETLSIAGNATASITMPNSTSAFMLVTSVNGPGRFIVSARCNSSGTVYYEAMRLGSSAIGVTFTTSTNTLTAQNNNPGADQFLIFRF